MPRDCHHLSSQASHAQMDDDYVDTLLYYFNSTYYAIREYSPDTFIMISPRIFEVNVMPQALYLQKRVLPPLWLCETSQSYLDTRDSALSLELPAVQFDSTPDGMSIYAPVPSKYQFWMHGPPYTKVLLELHKCAPRLL